MLQSSARRTARRIKVWLYLCSNSYTSCASVVTLLAASRSLSQIISKISCCITGSLLRCCICLVLSSSSRKPLSSGHERGDTIASFRKLLTKLLWFGVFILSVFHSTSLLSSPLLCLHVNPSPAVFERSHLKVFHFLPSIVEVLLPCHSLGFQHV